MQDRSSSLSPTVTRHRGLPLWIRYTLPILALALFLYSLPGQQLNGDEPWLGEQAYYRATEGVARSPMFRGMADVEKRVVVQHKLLVELGALTVWLWDWGLWPLRLVPIVFALVFLVFFGVYTERRGPPGAGWLAAGFLLLMPLYFHWGKIYRPEIMVIAFAFGSYVFLEASDKKHSPGRSLLSGLLAGAAAYSHYNGIAVIAAGAVTCLLLRRFREGALFLLGAVAALAPYLYEIASFRDLFYRQIFDNPMVSGKAVGGWTSWLISLAEEHKRLFRSPEILVATVPFIFAMASVTGKQLREEKIWYLFWFALLFFTALIVKSKLARYALVLHPFLVGETVRAAGRLSGHIANDKRKVISRLLVVTVSLSIVVSLVIDWDEAGKRSESPEETTARWARIIPEQATVVAPLSFVFNEIGRYDIIALDNIRFAICGDFSGTVDAESFFESCWAFNAEFAIIPLGYPEYSPVADSDGENLYRPVYAGETARIFRRLQPTGL